MILKRDFNQPGKMNRRFLALTGVFVLLFVFSLKYFHVASYADRDMNLMKAVPQDAMLLFQIENRDETAKIFFSLNYFNKLKETKMGMELMSCFSFCDTLFRGKRELIDALHKNQFVFSFHRSAQSASDIFFVFDLSAIDKPDFRKLLKLNFTNCISAERDFNDETIFEISTEKRKYTLAFKNEMLIISSNSFLVEKSIEQMRNNSSMLNDENFSSLCKPLSENFGVSVFVNDAQLVRSFSSLLNEKAAKKLKSLAQTFSWNEFDLNFEKNKISLKGFSVCFSFDPLSEFVIRQLNGSSKNNSSLSFKMKENEMEEFVSSLLLGDEKKSIYFPESFFKAVSSLQFSFDNNGSIVKTVGEISIGESIISATQTIWKKQLDANTITSPLVFLNRETNERMIAIEDTLQQLYLLNRHGEILWKKKIDGKIIGGVNAIDFYGDGSCHIAFNTERKIYVINMTGENDGGFPHALSFNATNPVTVLTPDATGGFRFLVACSNGKIYGFEQSGKPMEGWKPSAFVGKITFPIQWIVKDKKEFFFVQTANGVLKFFSRNGKKAAEDILTNDVFDEPFLFAQKKFSAASATGKFYQLGFDGKLNTNPISVLQSFVHASCFTDSFRCDVKVAKGNEKILTKKATKMEVIFLTLDLDKLTATLFDTTKVFETKFNKPSIRKMFLFRDEKIICLVDDFNKEILLVDFNGKIIQKISDAATSVNLISNDLVILSNGKNISAYNIH